MHLYENIKKLVEYGIQIGLTPECERVYTTNLLLELFHEDSYEDMDIDTSATVLEDVLKELLDEACRREIIENSITYRDLFDTKMMNCLLPRPAQVQETFRNKYAISPEAATAYYYKFSQDSDYIRRYRIKKDMKWTVDTQYGTLDITVNLSKPEKIRKQLPPPAMPLHLLTRNASFVWKTKDMPDARIIRRVKTTESFLSPLMTAHGDSNILRMYTTMNIVSYSTASILR